MRGVRLSCASKMLANYSAPYTATVVQRLIDAGKFTFLVLVAHAGRLQEDV